MSGKQKGGNAPGPDDDRPRREVDQDLVRAVAHPTRVRILEALQGRAASPTELSREFRESLGVVAYHSNLLLALGCIEQVRTRPTRGTVEHFYTSVPRSFIGHQDWREVPLTVRGGVTAEALRTFVRRVAAAIEAGTIDAREDTTLNWMPMTVDEQGWRESAEILDRALQDLQAVAAASRERLGGADGIPMATGLAAFEVPPGKG